VVEGLRRQGLSEVEIARGFSTREHPFTTTQLRALKSIAKNQQKQADIAMAQRLKDKGYSNIAIGQRMGINESSVRALLDPGQKHKADVLVATSNMLKEQVAKKGFVDVGTGVERHIGVSQTKLATAIARLQEEGYTVHYVKVEQLGTGQQTTLKVLAPPGTTYGQVFKGRDQIKQVTDHSDDGGRSYFGIQPPISVKSGRIAVRYGDQGGADADGVIYVRPGVDSLSLGGARYAQVRIAVNGTHYIKGMAMYKDDLPDGVDLMVNTNKSNTGDKMDAFKPMKDDPDNPFGAVVRQLTKTGKDGKKKVTSAMNIVNEEGDWENWSRSLSSQMLSKQSPTLARIQLDMTYDRKKRELDEIMALTNPAVRRKLLDGFADGADSASVHLKAAALPRQGSHVILPMNSMKPTEIYAPNYRDGERVALIRYPHGGIFEIPELTVNNRHPQARKILGNAKDAVGINSAVAKRLSGADFDGDTVLVIPNNRGTIKSAPALAGLKGFDPQASYPSYPGMSKMNARTKAIEMGVVSNLITDMTIRGASSAELARAVRHSMVVIDAEKHGLNYKQSAVDNGIAQLKAKYQGGARAGASTLISRAQADIRVPERRPRPASKGGAVDKATGRKVFEPTGATYTNARGKVVPKTIKSKRLAEVDDAHRLSSGTPIEKIYAEHSNKLKALANAARRASVNTKSTPYSPSAKTAYQKEVASLNAKLNTALKNAPLERQAQVLANATVSQKRRANPDMEPSELKRTKAQALAEMRIRTGAKKTRITLTDAEWAAIQSGAISNNKLSQILNNSDLDQIKALAAPKSKLLMTSAKQRRAQAMLASGYTQAEVADALGVSLTTLKDSLSS
jgi:DNA-binding CsgD family transcriptional regulator